MDCSVHSAGARAGGGGAAPSAGGEMDALGGPIHGRQCCSALVTWAVAPAGSVHETKRENGWVGGLGQVLGVV